MLLISSVTHCEELFRCISHETILLNIFYEIENLIIFYFSHQILTDRDPFAETCRIGVSKYLNGYRKSIACKENMYLHHWQAHALCSLKRQRMNAQNENVTWAHVISKTIGIMSTWIVLSVFIRIDRYAIS